MSSSANDGWPKPVIPQTSTNKFQIKPPLPKSIYSADQLSCIPQTRMVFKPWQVLSWGLVLTQVRSTFSPSHSPPLRKSRSHDLHMNTQCLDAGESLLKIQPTTDRTPSHHLDRWATRRLLVAEPRWTGCEHHLWTHELSHREHGTWTWITVDRERERRRERGHHCWLWTWMNAESMSWTWCFVVQQHLILFRWTWRPTPDRPSLPGHQRTWRQGPEPRHCWRKLQQFTHTSSQRLPLTHVCTHSFWLIFIRLDLILIPLDPNCPSMRKEKATPYLENGMSGMSTMLKETGKENPMQPIHHNIKHHLNIICHHLLVPWPTHTPQSTQNLSTTNLHCIPSSTDGSMLHAHATWSRAAKPTFSSSEDLVLPKLASNVFLFDTFNSNSIFTNYLTAMHRFSFSVSSDIISVPLTFFPQHTPPPLKTATHWQDKFQSWTTPSCIFHSHPNPFVWMCVCLQKPISHQLIL